MKKWFTLLGVMLCTFFCLTGCSSGKEQVREKVDFTVVDEERQPEELRKLLESKKEEAFRLTYTDQDSLYLCIGYGKQPTGGYSISVKEVAMAGENLYVKTLLVGPESKEKAVETPSYPMIVLMTQNREVQVNFE